MIDAPTREDATNIQLAQLLFRIFIYVTDTDKEVTPYEVQRFNRLLEDSRWTSNPELRRALERLRQDYTSLWTAYETRSLNFDLESISEQLESTWFSQTANVHDLRQSLRDFVQKIGQTGSPALARLGIVGAAVSKTAARTRIEGLLASEMRSLPAAAPFIASPIPVPPQIPGPIVAAGAPDMPWPAARLAFAEEYAWRGGRTRVRCVNVSSETADVKTYAFTGIPDRLFHYKPGQFLTIELAIDGRTVRRSYTISSSPTRPHLLCITVKRVPDGVVSNWLYDNMAEGVECFVSGPSGDFTCLNHPSEKLLLISGGSGVTPMMSMLRWISDTHSAADIVFINNVRTPADVIFERELQIISARMGGKLRLAVVPGLLTSGQSWNGITGPLNDHMLQTFAPDFMEREIFVCGPGGYMDMITNMLRQLGFPMERFHQENFSMAPAPAGMPPVSAAAVPPVASPARAIPASPPPAAAGKPPASAPKPAAAPALPPQAQKRVAATAASTAPSVVLEKMGKTFTCSADETILDAAERQGVTMASLCRSGICGTCRVHKSSGIVTMDDQKALSEADIEDGWVLTCVSHPQGPVVLEV